MNVCERREEENGLGRWGELVGPEDQPQDHAPLVPAVSGVVSRPAFQRLTSKDEPEDGLGQTLV